MHAALAAVLLVGLVSGRAWGDDLDERIPVEPGGVLEVYLDLGEGLRPDPGILEVVSHNADEVRVVAEASGWGGWGVRFRLDQQDEAVRLDGRVGGAVPWLFGGPHVQVRIWVPRQFSLDLRSRGAPIRVEDVHGAIRARAWGASIEVSGADGPLRLRCSDGDVRVSEVAGSVDVRSSAGSIEISWVEGDVEAHTGRGEIDIAHAGARVAAKTGRGAIELREVAGPVEAKTERGGVFASFNGAPAGSLETRRGGVEVVVPEGARMELDARARRGSVEVADNVKMSGERQGHRVAGPVNGGGPLLRLYTAHGGVRVSAR